MWAGAGAGATGAIGFSERRENRREIEMATLLRKLLFYVIHRTLLTLNSCLWTVKSHHYDNGT